MIFPIVQLEKNPPKTQKKETEREKKLFPLHPFLKKKRKKKKERGREEEKKRKRKVDA